ncbi:AlkA N-terminal domain-containing protein [Streptomyces sp. NPDC048172]|uniref:AlkA N-terminal domain-containing protein n=1 Tax=Streptomyces sp. NPDC048172 TaxID=3365505 RepID=UPI00372296B2
MGDDERYEATRSKDARFDGWFYVAVTSTGIYCRPSCPVVTPKRENVRFYASAAAAQTSGFRACKRCRPEAVPGSPQWNTRADVTGRAMRLIADGVVDRGGVGALASAIGYSRRQLHRLLATEVGAGPLALARAQRAQTARTLIDSSELPLADVAFAAGFSSVRQFNETVRQVFACTPSQLRSRARDTGRDGDRDRSRGREHGSAPGPLRLRLAVRPPIDLARLFRFLAVRAVPGVEEYVEENGNGEYRRVLALPHSTGAVALAPGDTGRYVWCRLRLDDIRDLGAAVQRCRRLLDLDADPQAVAASLGGCPVLAPLVRAAPGLRSPGHVTASELAVQALIGQQISLSAARTVAGRLTARYGEPLAAPVGGLTHVFPTPEALLDADPAALPMPGARKKAVHALAKALASGRVDLGPGADREESERRLLELPGIGPWTASYIRMRALGDPDVFMPTDLGVRHALERIGRPGSARPDSARAAAELAGTWRPWRSYALHHLWSVLDPPAPTGGTAPAVR